MKHQSEINTTYRLPVIFNCLDISAQHFLRTPTFLCRGSAGSHTTLRWKSAHILSSLLMLELVHMHIAWHLASYCATLTDVLVHIMGRIADKLRGNLLPAYGMFVVASDLQSTLLPSTLPANLMQCIHTLREIGSSLMSGSSKGISPPVSILTVDGSAWHNCSRYSTQYYCTLNMVYYDLATYWADYSILWVGLGFGRSFVEKWLSTSSKRFPTNCSLPFSTMTESYTSGNNASHIPSELCDKHPWFPMSS